MDEKYINEIKQVVEQANEGNWIPAAIVASALTIIVILLLYIYKRDRKEADKRHESHEELINKLTEVSANNAKIIAVHEAQIKNIEQRV